mmetsp:Transcript_86038/g.229603  ORF Transcript_86038/g.229603 Transcript_86038/m.229603 type:complete len:175 (+) Transcript_86038:54-578(+)
MNFSTTTHPQKKDLESELWRALAMTSENAGPAYSEHAAALRGDNFRDIALLLRNEFFNRELDCYRHSVLPCSSVCSSMTTVISSTLTSTDAIPLGSTEGPPLSFDIFAHPSPPIADARAFAPPTSAIDFPNQNISSSRHYDWIPPGSDFSHSASEEIEEYSLGSGWPPQKEQRP